MSTATVESIIDDIIEREGNGAYTDDPNDSGGPTRWGIIERTARANGYPGDMREFPRAAVISLVNNCYNNDSYSKYQRLASPIIGHAWAGSTASEATNIGSIVSTINSVSSTKGCDCYLMLHRVVPTSTVDGSMDTTKIRLGDLETITTAIKTNIDSGTLEAVTMPDFCSDQTIWNTF